MAIQIVTSINLYASSRFAGFDSSDSDSISNQEELVIERIFRQARSPPARFGLPFRTLCGGRALGGPSRRHRANQACDVPEDGYHACYETSNDLCYPRTDARLDPLTNKIRALPKIFCAQASVIIRRRALVGDGILL
jgi:hypothetical protein